ncbi:MAG: hypothetical protein B7Z55_02075 [Planctomycetales bacterium 12-60-4]|nr:MAG: hypothetical protein B7Z55_02075 [Planctomycetales bacterium 12-60-4]
MSEATDEMDDSQNRGSGSTSQSAEILPGAGLPELAERLEFLGFTETDRQQLESLQEPFAEIAGEFFAAFYERLTTNPCLAALLDEPGLIDRLNALQHQYFVGLMSGPYDEDYAQSRLKIGLAHQRIGLEPVWYLAAYCQYMQLCFPRFAMKLGTEFPPAILSLLKIAFADISLQQHDRSQPSGRGVRRRQYRRAGPRPLARRDEAAAASAVGQSRNPRHIECAGKRLR